MTSQRKMPNFSRALAVNQDRLVISRTRTPPTKAPALAAPMQSHKQRSGITYDRFECGPRLSSKGPRSAIPSGANCIQHTLSGIQHTARFFLARAGKPVRAQGWFWAKVLSAHALMTMSMNGRGSARQGATSRRREVSGWPQVARDSASRLSSPAVEDADLKSCCGLRVSATSSMSIRE
jgi:hypothetical protein